MLAIFNAVSKVANRVGFWTKAHAPEILIGSGIVAGMVGTFLACKATKDSIPVIDEAKEEIKTINENRSANSEDYTEADAKNDKVSVYFKTTGKLAKNYAPAVGVLLAGTVSILAGSGILKKRNVALATGLAASIGEFNDYRKNLIEKFGDEGETIDKELRHGVKDVEVKEEVVDNKGKKKTVKKKVKTVTEELDCNGYRRVFDSRNPYWDADPTYNEMFLKARQNYFNDKLRVDGHVFLNDVLKSLGFHTTRIGQEVGWRVDPNDETIDNYIDFGVYDIDIDKSSNNHTFMLEFNVDGSILNKVDWPDQV